MKTYDGLCLGGPYNARMIVVKEPNFWVISGNMQDGLTGSEPYRWVPVSDDCGLWLHDSLSLEAALGLLVAAYVAEASR